MLNKLLSRRRNVYIFALIAIFIESFSAVCLKMAGLYPVISTKYIFYFFIYFVLSYGYLLHLNVEIPRKQ